MRAIQRDPPLQGTRPSKAFASGTAARPKPSVRAQDTARPAFSTRASAATRADAAEPAAEAAKRAPLPSVAAAGASTNVWPCRDGQLVRVVQELGSTSDDGGGAAHAVHVYVEQLAHQGGAPELHWGVYRSSPTSWQHPQAVVPPGSRMHDSSGVMCSPMAASPGAGGAPGITLTVPAALAPLSLAFVVALPPGDASVAGAKTRYVTPLQGRHFTALIGALPGSATPLGPSLARGPPRPEGAGDAQGATVNFAVRCRGGDHVSLVVLKPPAEGGEGGWGRMEFALDPVVNRTGATWHVALPGLHGLDHLCYGWRVDGDVSWESGHRVQPGQVMLDPAAPALAHLPAAPPPPLPLPTLRLGGGRVALAASSLASLAPGHAGGGGGGGGVSPPLRRALEEMRVLEIDVRTFSSAAAPGAAAVAHPGTFLGVAERVDHIRAVGANAVVLTPCCACAEGVGPMGRAAVSFMAPDPELSTNPRDPAAAAAELRAMVHALHAAGVEVLPSLDVAFTAEGTDAAPAALSLRGLDHSAYFRANGVLNCGQPAVWGLLGGALRRWAADFGVDGFCFLNAENMVQDADGVVLDAPPLAEELCMDPQLAGLKLVAVPSNDALLPRIGARGFPHWGLWLQRNSAFPRDMAAYLVHGAGGQLPTVARRLAGSADVFAEHRGEATVPGNLSAARRPAFGLNSVTFLGGPPLGEVVAAAAAAGGGDAPAPAATLAKSLLVAVILARGTPTVSQDVTADVEMARFVGVMMRLRRRLAHLLAPPLFDAPAPAVLTWHGAGGGEPEWGGGGAHGLSQAPDFLAFCVRHEADGSAVYVAWNPHLESVAATLPSPPDGHQWLRAADTALPAPHDAALDDFAPIEGLTYALASKGAVVLVAGCEGRL